MQEEIKKHHSKKNGLIWILIIAIAAFYFSNGVSFLVRMVPWSVEMRLAHTLNSYYRPNVCANGDPNTELAFQKFVTRLYPLAGVDDEKKVQFKITIIHNEQVNAFATLGGEIYVLSGLLRDVETPEELAGVIAHEMAHIKERHVLQGLLIRMIFNNNNLSDGFFNIGFTKGEEHEADVLGLERLKIAKINAKGYYDFFNKREKESPKWLAVLSDHPNNDFRKSLAQKYLGLPCEKILEQDEWKLLKNLCN